MIYFAPAASPLGPMTMASDGESLVGLWFDGQRYDRQLPASTLPIFSQTRAWLAEYFAGHAPSFTPPLKLSGTPFRQRVYERLLKIPYGETTTYGALARAIPGASPRAVGNAVGHNPISLIVPCHRVIASSGALTGYAGGLDRKRALLALEGVL